MRERDKGTKVNPILKDEIAILSCIARVQLLRKVELFVLDMSVRYLCVLQDRYLPL